MKRESVENQTLAIKEHLGYGSGSIGDALAYTMIGSFLMFFLTTIAGIKPFIAGSILAAGAVWNAFINPIVGFLSDKIHSRFGRRRPMILFFSIPLAISMFLAFTNLPIAGFLKPVYYGLVLMLLWTSYTGFFVPYLALGTGYTRDYRERTTLRLYASAFNSIGVVMTMTMPLLLVKALRSLGFSTNLSWSAVGACTGLLATASIVVTVITSKEKDPPQEKTQIPHIRDIRLKEIFREYLDIAKLQPMKYLVIASVFSLIAYTMIMSDMVYFLTYNRGLDADKLSLALLSRAVLGLFFIPVVGKLSKKIDKRATLIFFYFIAACGMFLIRFTGVDTFPQLCLYVLFVSLCTSIYWQLIPSIYYDVCDYDRMVSGKSRQGSILSFQGLVEAVAGGVGAQLLGLLLSIYEFQSDKLTQSERALEGIFNCTTFIPVLFLLAAIYPIYKYPITRETHSRILKALKEDKDGIETAKSDLSEKPRQT